MWTDLTQEEKFNIMRDYVRRGFHNLDDIMNDYNNNTEYVRQIDVNKPVAPPSAMEDVLNEWYSNTIYPDQGEDIDY